MCGPSGKNVLRKPGNKAARSAIPRPTPASGGVESRVRRLQVRRVLPCTFGNRFEPGLAAGPAPCLLFGESAAAPAKADLLPAEYRCDRATCSNRFPLRPTHGRYVRRHATILAAWVANSLILNDSLTDLALIEKLAELEHEQWCQWSKNLVEKEKLSKERIDRWAKLWVPYSELSEEMKESDRIWARKALRIFLGGKE